MRAPGRKFPWRAFGLATVSICVPLGGQAAPRSITDCAAITNAFAYNACLAQFGPKMGEQHFQPAPPAAGAAPTVTSKGRAGARNGGPQRVGGSIFAHRTANGRVIAEFQVGPSTQKATPTVPRKRRRLPNE